jgi:hypothetical protein
MPIGYTPDPEASSNSYEELKDCTADFKVEAFAEETFKTGTKGAKAKLLVGYNGRDVPCYVNLFYDKATWKLKSFLECIGLDYDSPPEIWEIEGRYGRAKFKVNKEGYFEVARFLDSVDSAMDPQAGAETRGKKRESGYTPPPVDDSDVPF